MTPSLLAPIAERFQYGGLTAVSPNELLNALEELDIVKLELDDARCEASSFEEDAEIANFRLEDEEERSAGYAKSLGELDNVLADAVRSIDKSIDTLPDGFELPPKFATLIDTLRDKLENARELCETED